MTTMNRQETWKPVSEGLPTHGGQVLITWTFMNTYKSASFVSAARYEKGHWDWNSKIANEYRRDEEVQAWMDQPRPYRPEPPRDEESMTLSSARGDIIDECVARVLEQLCERGLLKKVEQVPQ